MPEIDLGPIIGPQGPQGATGPAGAVGPGVPAGGTAGQIVTKKSSTGFDAEWRSPVNDANQTEAGYVLDARMGKTLGDLIKTLQSVVNTHNYLENNTDLNTITSPGLYQLSGNRTYINAPASYGVLEVVVGATGSEQLIQRLWTTGEFYYRYKSDNLWYPWKTIKPGYADATTFQVGPSSTKSFTVANNTRANITLAGARDDVCGVLIVSATSGGVISTNKLGASNISVTKNTNTLTLENTNSAVTCGAYVQLFNGNITENTQ